MCILRKIKSLVGYFPVYHQHCRTAKPSIYKVVLTFKSVDEILKWLPGGDSHMKQTGMLVGNFEFNP